jgi:ribosomal protein L7/L12
MNEPFWLGMVVGALIVATLLARVASGNRHVGTLSRLEGKLDAAVLDALRSGRKIEGIKEYRAATGAGLKDAKDYAEELQRRGASRA